MPEPCRTPASIGRAALAQRAFDVGAEKSVRGPRLRAAAPGCPRSSTRRVTAVKRPSCTTRMSSDRLAV